MRTSWTGYSSVLAQHIERYLASKRALGCKFNSEDRTLRLFDRWLVEQGLSSLGAITGACLEAFLASRHRDNPRSYVSFRQGCVAADSPGPRGQVERPGGMSGT